MHNISDTYDVAVVGGGLAGLTTAIQLARKGHQVILFEKEYYPFHKVCGEYISMESWGFLERLSLPLGELSLPLIDTLTLTAPNGKAFTTKLPLGGFGISRYALDHLLANIAKKEGVLLLEGTRVSEISRPEEHFLISFASRGNYNRTEVAAKLVFGSFGKRSNIDVKWKRSFIIEKDNRQNNYVGVKYHIQTSWSERLIGLHNFRDGYCGISKVEKDKYCLCYLTTAGNLKASGNSITAMQENILYKNPALKNIFINSVFSSDFPVTISQISFSKKALVEKGVLMIGDAAGMITPLCGNGMSMAMHGGKIAVQCADNFLKGSYSRKQMEEAYIQQWNNEFKSRLKMGRLLQSFFGADVLSNMFVSTFRAFPFLAGSIIKKTHGKPF